MAPLRKGLLTAGQSVGQEPCGLWKNDFQGFHIKIKSLKLGRMKKTWRNLEISSFQNLGGSFCLWQVFQMV